MEQRHELLLRPRHVVLVQLAQHEHGPRLRQPVEQKVQPRRRGRVARARSAAAAADVREAVELLDHQREPVLELLVAVRDVRREDPEHAHQAARHQRAHGLVLVLDQRRLGELIDRRRDRIFLRVVVLCAMVAWTSGRARAKDNPRVSHRTKVP